jgi:WD40 repeat protein
MPPIPTYIPLITPTAFVPTPTMPIAKEPPSCTFPLPQTTTEESSPENYTFSDPRVMITDQNAAFSIIQWLPDSQRALIVRDVIKKGYEQYNSIELFNPRTVKVQVYAQPKYRMLPSWIPGLDGVLYPETRVNSYSTNANGMSIASTVVSEQILSISNGDPNKIQNIEDEQYKPFVLPHEWIISSLAVKPDGSQIVYLKTNGKNLFQFYSREVSQGSLRIEQLIPFDTSLWAYKPQWAYTQLSVDSYGMAWRPNSTQIFLTANNSIYGSMYSFILDLDTGKICQIDFGSAPGESKHAEVARWSPNGRYLAIVRGWGYFPVDFTDLDVLDTLTGKQYTLAFSLDVKGTRYVTDIAWGPDNYHLVAIGEVNSFEHCAYSNTCIEPVDRLYLVDLISGKADLLFPSFQFSSGWGTGLAWSPDGSKLLATCWDGSESRLCLVPVQKTEK